MSKEQEYPGMNGWVSIRLTPVGQETDNNGTQQSTSANFESFYLTLKVSFSYFFLMILVIDSVSFFALISHRMVACVGLLMNKCTWDVDVDIL